MLLRGSPPYRCSAVCMVDEPPCVAVSQLPCCMQGCGGGGTLWAGRQGRWPGEADLVPGVRGDSSLPSEAPGSTGKWVNRHVGQSNSAGMEA